MKQSLDRAYYDLGKAMFEAGIAEAFGIEPNQKIDFNNVHLLLLIGFIVHHADDSIACYEEEKPTHH